MDSDLKIKCPDCKGSGKSHTEIISHGLVDYESSWPCNRCNESGYIAVNEVKSTANQLINNPLATLRREKNEC